MPATPEELKRLVDAFEEAHAPVARAMADLLIRGNVILEEHRMLEGAIGDAFEAFVFMCSRTTRSRRTPLRRRCRR